MDTRSKLLIGAVGAVFSILGVALATPIVGLLSPLLAVGNRDADLHARGTAPTLNGEAFRVHLDTDGPSTVSIQDFSLAAGGHNGWHSHPGMVIVTLLSGSITWYDEDCKATNYDAGDSWVEGSQLHAFRVTSPKAIHAMAVFITAKGEALRTDRPAPACGAELGL